MLLFVHSQFPGDQEHPISTLKSNDREPSGAPLPLDFVKQLGQMVIQNKSTSRAKDTRNCKMKPALKFRPA